MYARRQRLPRQHVFYYRSPVHQNHYVLSFAFAFEKEDEVYQFAVAPPYSFSRLQSYLTVMETRFAGTFVRSELTKTLVIREPFAVSHNENAMIYAFTSTNHSRVANSN